MWKELTLFAVTLVLLFAFSWFGRYPLMKWMVREMPWALELLLWITLVNSVILTIGDVLRLLIWIRLEWWR